VLIGLTFFPLPLPPLAVDGPAFDLNLRPLRTIGPALDFGPGSQQFRLLVGNLLAFVPLGVLLPLAGLRHSWARVAMLGLALTVAIELGQLLVSVAIGYAYRSADIDDVIVNWLGAALGYAAYRFAAAIAPSRSP
jgi:glycopeptide antibiotics resistance protein